MRQRPGQLESFKAALAAAYVVGKNDIAPDIKFGTAGSDVLTPAGATTFSWAERARTN